MRINLKDNHSDNLIKKPQAVFSVLFSLMLVLSRHIINNDADRTTLESTYFTDVHLIDLAAWILIAVLIYVIVSHIPVLRKDMFYGKDRESACLPQLFICWGVIIICYLPYIFSYWPGGVYSDTMNSIWIALGDDAMTTHEPIGYTLLWKLMYAIGGGNLEPGNYGGINLFTIMQCLGFSGLYAAFINWNYRRGLKRSVTVALTLIFALVPIFPFWAISLWKDAVFGIIIFLYSWFIFCMLERVHGGSLGIRDLIIYILLSILVVFFRNNGIYVMIFTSVILLISLWRNKDIRKKLGIATLAMIIGCLLIEHPLFDLLGFNVDTAVESMALPIEQTGYIISTDGNLSESDIEVLSSIMPIETWKEVYSPVNVDYMKFDGSFDRDYFNNNIGEFFKTYLHICLKNPVKALKGYLLGTIGFWDVFEETGNAYICPESIAWTGVYQGDWFSYHTGFSFRELVYPRHYISAAVCVWVMLLSVFLAIGFRKGERWRCLPMMPALGVWITIMLAVPLAFSFRYVFAVFLCIPVYLVCLVQNNSVTES